MRTPARLGAFGAGLIVLAVGAAPFLASAADHLDAPALGGVSNGAVFAPHSEHGDRDINDVYVFNGTTPGHPNATALVMTTNPAINLFGGNFGTNVRYIINVDKNGDAVQDLAYVTTFGDEMGNGSQRYKVTRYEGSRARSLSGGSPINFGVTNTNDKSRSKDSVWAWAGVRSDPFFFDLTGFLGSLKGVGTDCIGCDATDFFAALNTNAIVLEVPDAQLGRHIGVWGQTQYWNGSAWIDADQMGRPAINTVFNPTADKNDFNTTAPSQQRTAFGGKFRNNIIAALQALGGYTAAQAAGLADVLLPDVITYDTTTVAAGPLNGRGLADDVIDIEYSIVTNGALTSDGVGPHGDYMTVFPYLGAAH